MNEGSPAAASSRGKSSQCLQGNWKAERVTYQFSHVSQLLWKGLGLSTTLILWCISTIALFSSSIIYGSKSSGCKEDAHHQVASSEQLTRFPFILLFSWYFRIEKSPCMQINQESFTCWTLQQYCSTDLQGGKKKIKREKVTINQTRRDLRK